MPPSKRFEAMKRNRRYLDAKAKRNKNDWDTGTVIVSTLCAIFLALLWWLNRYHAREKEERERAAREKAAKEAGRYAERASGDGPSAIKPAKKVKAKDGVCEPELVGTLARKPMRVFEKPKVVEKGVYTHRDGRKEVVEVVAKYDEGSGGGFAIFIQSLGRERDIMPHRLDCSPEAVALCSYLDLGTFLGGGAKDEGDVGFGPSDDAAVDQGGDSGNDKSGGAANSEGGDAGEVEKPGPAVVENCDDGGIDRGSGNEGRDRGLADEDADGVLVDGPTDGPTPERVES